MALTELEIGRATAYIVRRMTAAGVSVHDTGQVLRYLIENPLPSKAVWEAEEVTEEEALKQRQIVSLRNQLDKLEGR